MHTNRGFGNILTLVAVLFATMSGFYFSTENAVLNRLHKTPSTQIESTQTQNSILSSTTQSTAGDSSNKIINSQEKGNNPSVSPTTKASIKASYINTNVIHVNTTGAYCYEKKIDADMPTFVQIDSQQGNSYYGKDKNHVYSCGGHDANSLRVETGVDQNTFTVVKTGGTEHKNIYSKDAKHVYYLDEDNGLQALDKADPSTFTTNIAGNNRLGDFGKDRQHVYLHNKLIAEAEPDTFQILGGSSSDFNFKTWLAKDAQHVYIGDTYSFNYKVITGADASSFSILGKATDYENFVDSYLYAKDKNHVYTDGTTSETDPVGKVILGADPATFTILRNDTIYFNAVNKGGVAKDKNSVYLGSKVIHGANPATFKLEFRDGMTILRDATQVFNIIEYTGIEVEKSRWDSILQSDGPAEEIQKQ